MKPHVIEIDPANVDIELLKQAAEVIHNRGLVAFPTETVYGLGANALDPKAVTGIFETKERPLDDPLIVHIADMNDLHELSEDIPRQAYKLVERFWAGPLTLVVRKKKIVPDIVTTGLDTVAVRMPSNIIAREFIKVAGVPLAAPSANLFGRPSPTTARHVLDDLEGKIDVILDGGRTAIGVESTVVEFIDDRIIVLRPGGIPVEELVKIVGDVEVVSEQDIAERSPGKYPQHYSPRAKVIVIENSPRQIEETSAVFSEMRAAGRKTGILAKQEHENMYEKSCMKILGPEEDGKTCASRLFHLLREFDDEEVDVIIAEAVSEKGLGLAVMNRLKKAAGPDENFPSESL